MKINGCYRGSHTKKEKRRTPWPAVMLCLMLAVIMTTGVSFAKYVTKAEGRDAARVAGFKVTVSLTGADNVKVNNDENKDDSITLTVKNDSEVAVEYDVVVKAAIPEGISISLDGVVAAENKGTYTFSNAGKLAVALSESHTLTFTPSDSVALGEQTIEDIEVKVVATQID